MGGDGLGVSGRVAEVDCASEPTDSWCAFVADTTDRAAGVDCAAEPPHAGCACIASAEEQLGALFTTDMSAVVYADWLGDGNCHTIFDTGACHSDGGDCGTGDVVATTTKFRGGFGLLGFVLFFITSDHSSERRTKSTTHQQ